MAVRGKGRSPTIRILFLLLAAALPLGLIGGGAYGYWTVFQHRFAAVTDGVVYRSAAMPPDELVEVVREHGIRTVIDLRKDGDEVEAERRALTAAGARHVHLPSEQVPTPETVGRFLRTMDDAANLPVLIHCEHGEGRSVLFAAIYRIEYEGWSNEDAWHATRIIPSRSSFAREHRKGEFLLSYRPRRLRTAGIRSSGDQGSGDT